MHSQFWRTIAWPVLVLSTSGFAQQSNSYTRLMNFKAPGVEISKAAPIAAGTTEPNPWGPGHSAPIPAYCHVEGVINRRTGVGGEEFGIQFALAMPEKWNGDFLMQGGGGGNGVVMAPLGLNAAGDTPALMRGFAVVSTDTGHKSHRGRTLYVNATGEEKTVPIGGSERGMISGTSYEGVIRLKPYDADLVE